MVAIVGVRVIMYAARAIISKMGPNDSDNGQCQEPVLLVVPDLLGNQEQYTHGENKKWRQAMVMAAVSVP
jgi:hypothetical protein